jgi:hypothetical protein
MPPEPAVRIVHYIHDHTRREPIPELADIWPRVQQVVTAQTALNNAADKFPQQQLAIAHEGKLVMPSPFADRTDTATESYYLYHRFFYRFAGTEEYYWSTAVPEQLLAAVWFPRRGVVVCLHGGAVDATVVDGFAHLRTEVPKPDDGARPAERRTALVVGFGQFMHMLWNHLPALERAITAGIAPKLPVMVTQQPFGPIEDIFPELAGRTAPLAPSGVIELNREYAMLVGLGSRRLPRSVRERVQQAARRHASRLALAQRERFRAGHAPVFWFSIKPPDRTAFNQAEALAAIIAEIKAAYPEAGFVLDGPSRPWDLEQNDNYGYFRGYIESEIEAAGGILEDIVARVGPVGRASVMALNGTSVCDNIAWQEIADFYFCHGGTAHHKIGWVRDTPGMIYSNSRFVAYYKWMNPLQPPPPVWYLPARLVADDPDENYPPEKLARKDQNFTLLDPREIAREILNAFHEVRKMTDQIRPSGTETPPPSNEVPAPSETGQDPAGNSKALPAECFRLPDHAGHAAGEVIRLLHTHLRPKTYLEAGTEDGSTLGHAGCPSIAIGERIAISGEMIGGKPCCALFQMSTDEFFASYDPKRILNGPVDVAYLHGIRLFETLLRAFRSVERHCKPNSVVLVENCLPVDSHMARRDFADRRFAELGNGTDHWAGDAWKFAVILKKVRPELRIRAFNATPAGLLAITNLDPESSVLDKQYFALTEQLRAAILNQQGIETLMKAMAVGGTEVFQRYETLSPLFWL